jgi:hypothetical protein
VESFAKDFGYDLDEEGQPLDDDVAPAPSRDAAEKAPEREAAASAA